MKIVTWNIRHGGGLRVGAIVEALRRLDPDVLSLSEFRDGRAGEVLMDGLAASGWPHQATSKLQGSANGVLLAAREPLQVLPPAFADQNWEGRIVHVRHAAAAFVAIYFPLGRPKIPFFKSFMSAFGDLGASRIVLMGDFNTGKHFLDEAGATFVGPEYMDALESSGFTDAWRHLYPGRREYTWFSSKGHGFRLDHVFLGKPLLPSLSAASHVHAVREQGTSDHSVLCVDLEWNGAGAQTVEQ